MRPAMVSWVDVRMVGIESMQPDGQLQDLLHKHPQFSHIVRKLLATEHIRDTSKQSTQYSFSPLPFNRVLEAGTKLMGKCIPPSRRKKLGDRFGLTHRTCRTTRFSCCSSVNTTFSWPAALLRYTAFSIPVNRVDSLEGLRLRLRLLCSIVVSNGKLTNRDWVRYLFPLDSLKLITLLGIIIVVEPWIGLYYV